MTTTSRSKRAEQIFVGFAKAIGLIAVDDSFSQAVDKVIECKGKIVTTGMGKAGIAMRKFSSTLCSLGFSSCYLHPGEASHGDLGIISEGDILFVASTSGKTREVMEIMMLSENIGTDCVIGITSHPDSP